MNPKDRVLEALQTAERILLVMHAAPDGDSAGSAIALGLALRALGRVVTFVSHDAVSERLSFLPESQNVVRWDEAMQETYDVVVSVDCGSPGRLAAPDEFWLWSIPLINIDHHRNNPEFGTINWVQSETSATGEMIAELIQYAKWPLTPEQAVCLYTAISTDTLSFRQVNTTPSTLKIAHWLTTSGMDLRNVNRVIWDCRPLGEVRFLGWALGQAKLSADGRFVWLVVSRQDMDQFGTDDMGVDMVIHHLLAIDSVQVAIVVKESLLPNQAKVSWRGKAPWDVAALASAFGGGGHTYAAAAQAQGTLDAVTHDVLGALGLSDND